MKDSELPTPIRACFERLTAGDANARDELLYLTRSRLLAMTRKMLARYPCVRRWEESDDVLQNVLIRLERCFAEELIRSPADYFRLAATSIRRAVIDLARHYYGPLGMGTNHFTPYRDHQRERPEEAVGSDRDNPARLARVRELHEMIDSLPTEVRDVVHFHWYLGMTLPEAADALGLSLSTAKRRYIEARKLLQERLGNSREPNSH